LIIDAGTGIRPLGDILLQRGGQLDLLLLLTHIHWDHILGFPFFRPLFEKETRIIVEGSSKGLDGLRHVFSNRYIDGTWPVKFEDLEARIEAGEGLRHGKMLLGDTLIESHGLQHPQGGVGFRFTERSRSLVFLTDNELVKDGWAGTRFKDFVTFCRDADLLIHDCQYLPEEIVVRRGWGHSDIESVAKLAMEATVKRLVLFHHDPWRKDSEVARMVELGNELFDRAAASIPTEAARERSMLSV